MAAAACDSSAAGAEYCLLCEASYDEAYTSDYAASTCRTCKPNFYRDWSSPVRVAKSTGLPLDESVPPGNPYPCLACPTTDGLGKDWTGVGVTLATCPGGDMMPVPAGPQPPDAPWGFWVDRGDLELAGNVYPCLTNDRCGIAPKEVAVFSLEEAACWSVPNQTRLDPVTLLPVSRTRGKVWGDTAACDSDNLQCVDGAQGMLCGTCIEGFHKTAAETCERCGGSIDQTQWTVVGVFAVFLVSAVAVRVGWVKRLLPKRWRDKKLEDFVNFGTVSRKLRTNKRHLLTSHSPASSA